MLIIPTGALKGKKKSSDPNLYLQFAHVCIFIRKIDSTGRPAQISSTSTASRKALGAVRIRADCHVTMLPRPTTILVGQRTANDKKRVLDDVDMFLKNLMPAASQVESLVEKEEKSVPNTTNILTSFTDYPRMPAV